MENLIYFACAALVLLNIALILVIKGQQIQINRLKRETRPLEPIELYNDWGGMRWDVSPEPVIFEAEYMPVGRY